jgi:hypothetical protein
LYPGRQLLPDFQTYGIQKVEQRTRLPTYG